MDDMEVEIADARMILWTNIVTEGQPILSAESEARIIRDLIARNIVFEKVGIYSPPQPPPDELRYNLSVAQPGRADPGADLQPHRLAR